MNSSNNNHENNHGHKPEFYYILVDHKPHDWPKPTITGSEIKGLTGVDQSTFDAWQDVPGPDDKLVGNDEEVVLTGKGAEKFFTVKKTTKEG